MFCTLIEYEISLHDTVTIFTRAAAKISSDTEKLFDFIFWIFSLALLHDANGLLYLEQLSEYLDGSDIKVLFQEFFFLQTMEKILFPPIQRKDRDDGG